MVIARIRCYLNEISTVRILNFFLKRNLDATEAVFFLV